MVLDGPTDFRNCVQKMISQSSPVSGKIFRIHVVATDGAFHYMAETIELIIDASKLGISIIIIGIGPGPFNDMKALDSDGSLLKDKNGRTASRDIVQFVEYNKFLKKGKLNMYKLAKEVLAEVPDQFISYMRLYSFLPDDPGSSGSGGSGSGSGGSGSAPVKKQ